MQPDSDPVTDFQQEHGIWVYRTGDPMPPTLADETLAALRREREEGLVGRIPK